MEMRDARLVLPSESILSSLIRSRKKHLGGTANQVAAWAAIQHGDMNSICLRPSGSACSTCRDTPRPGGATIFLPLVRPQMEHSPFGPLEGDAARRPQHANPTPWDTTWQDRRLQDVQEGHGLTLAAGGTDLAWLPDAGVGG